MLLSRVGSALLSIAMAFVVVGAVGCTQQPKLIGEACKTSADCNSENCGVKGLCTRTCKTQGECPVGFDCTPATEEATERTCNAAAYPVIEAGKGGYDTGCTAELCTKAPSPCATDQGFYCYAADGNDCSAAAVCTRDCETNADCPTNFFCGENKIGSETKHVCLERKRCSDCRFDDDCPAEHACAADSLGAHFCGKRCNIDDDCLKPAKGGNPFENCVEGICTPVTGACHGKSSIDAITEENSLCSPCRVGVPGDCGENLVCYEGYTGERSCITGCRSAIQQTPQGYVATDDGNCPGGLTCLLTQLGDDCNGGMAQNCTGLGICTADKSGQSITCY